MTTGIDMELNDIPNMCQKLSLPSFVESEANRIFDICKNMEGFENVSLLSICSVYAACKVLDIGKTEHDFGVWGTYTKDQLKIRKMYREMCYGGIIQPKLTCPMKLVSKIISKAKVNPLIEYTAISIIQSMQKCGVSARKPDTLAAAAIFAAGRLHDDHTVYQRHVAQAAGVMSVSLRIPYLEIMNQLAKTDYVDLLAQ